MLKLLKQIKWRKFEKLLQIKCGKVVVGIEMHYVIGSYIILFRVIMKNELRHNDGSL